MRASGADREQVIEILKAAYVYGLVTKDEFDARVGRALARADLAIITGDIPAGLAAAPATLSPPPVKAMREATAQPTAAAKASVAADFGLGERAVVVPAALAGLALIISVLAGNSAPGQVALGAALECALLSLLFLPVARTASSWREKKGRRLRA